MSEQQKPIRQIRGVIESRYANNKESVNQARLQPGKISFWEYGWDVTLAKDQKDQEVIIDVYEEGPNFMKVRFINPTNENYRLSISNKRKPKTKFGYNKTGCFNYILTKEGEELKQGQHNAVMIYSLDDMDLFEKAYWWGREDDILYAFLNEIHKSIFYFYY